MADKKIVLIIGAGASAEYKLPTGVELKHQIAKLLDIRFGEGFESPQADGDKLIYSAYVELCRNKPVHANKPYIYQKMGWRIRDAMPQAPSIDNFIDANRGDELLEQCCKLAIARAILDAERHCPLFIESTDDDSFAQFHDLENTWLSPLFHLISGNKQKADLPQRLSSISLIIFNYDRCVEHFLYYTFQKYYGMQPDEVATLLRYLTIFHPYGVVGSLPWQGQNNQIDFGSIPNVKSLLSLTGQIRTFTEGTDPNSSSIYEIRQNLLHTNIALFLGFAYHALNIELLKTSLPMQKVPLQTRYFGTAIGISPSDCKLISKELTALGNTSEHLVTLRPELTCAQLFREYQRSISFT